MNPSSQGAAANWAAWVSSCTLTQSAKSRRSKPYVRWKASMLGATKRRRPRPPSVDSPPNGKNWPSVDLAITANEAPSPVESAAASSQFCSLTPPNRSSNESATTFDQLCRETTSTGTSRFAAESRCAISLTMWGARKAWACSCATTPWPVRWSIEGPGPARNADTRPVRSELMSAMALP